MSKRTSKHPVSAELMAKQLPEAPVHELVQAGAEELVKKKSTVARGATAQNHPSLKAMIADTADAIIAIDEHFHVVDFNATTSTALGWSPQKAIGRRCSDILHCCNLNRMALCGTSSCPLVKVLQQKHALANEELILADSCEVSTSVTPVELDGGERYAVFTARDVSALKVANQVRANFVSMVSHELRTPLNSVHGFIDLLLQGHMGSLSVEQLKYLGYAQEGVQQLISIVEDILFMTRSDVGQFEIKQEEVNFRVLSRQVASSLEPQARKAGVAIFRDIPFPTPMLYADPQRIKQVLNNLVTNAIKFTPPEGTVTIQARRQDEQDVLISVTDTGYGIPPEDRAHIFERFYQSNHSLQSKMGGYGLGLSIARLIVEQHGGTIYFETVMGKGTTFFFTVPLYTGQAAQEL